MRLLFIRFGEIPKFEKSKNHLTGTFEKGVSVYEGIEKNGFIQIIFPSLTYSACVSLSGCIDRKIIFEVAGDVVGVGSDGEPLIVNCKILKQFNEFEGKIISQCQDSSNGRAGV